MTWHRLIHWLDTFRHFMAFAWAPINWITNVTGGIVYAVGAIIVAAIFWPPLRRMIECFFHHIFSTHPIHGEIEHLHKKLNALLEHHGVDVPDLKQ